MPIRTARGYEAVHHPYQELYEGSRPSLQGLRASSVLPIAWLDLLHDDDPVALLPGTFVGLLNTGVGIDTASTFNDAEEAARRLVPSHQNAYVLSYTQYDVDFGTPDIDNDGTAVASAGDSTAVIGPIKPIGVVTAPVYHTHLATLYTNYSRDLTPSVLCGNYSVVIPAITANEKLIQPGDLVMIDDTASPEHDPRNVGSTSTHVAGRVRSWDATATGQITDEFVVGRCIHKWRVAAGTASTRLSTDLNNSVTLTNVNSDWQYNTLSRVQTVPGLGLAGSDTQGVPSMFKHAYSDANGDYWALELRLDL